MAYGRVPSIVWKPREKEPPDVIDEHVLELREFQRQELIEELIKKPQLEELIKQIHVGLALAEDRRGQGEAYQRELPRERRRLETFVIMVKKDGDIVVLTVYGGGSLLDTKRREFDYLAKNSADINQLRTFLSQLPMDILQLFSAKSRESQDDLAEYLGLAEDEPKEQFDEEQVNGGGRDSRKVS
jgi:hypothetical protein